MHNGHVRQETKKETKSTSSNGWGMFDSLAKLSQTTDRKEQKKLENQVNNAARQFSGGENQVQQAISNARTIASGGQTEKQKEKEKIEAEKAGQVVTTTGDGITPVIKTKPKQKFFGFGKPIKTLSKERLAEIMAAIQNYKSNIPGGLDAFIKTLGALTVGRYKALFGKENLIRDDLGIPFEDEFGNMKTRSGTMTLEGLNKFIGSEDKKSLKRDNPDLYYNVFKPTTSGDMVDLAQASKEGRIEFTKENTLMIQQARDMASDLANRASPTSGLAGLGGGGGGGGTQPVDPNDPDAGMMPPETYLASQYNQALIPDPNLDPYKNAMYATGIEQQHIAGGYWDPNTHQWVDQQGPWGTQNLWQGSNPTEPLPTIGVAEGGPVRAPSSKVTNGGGGLFNFKAYGF